MKQYARHYLSEIFPSFPINELEDLSLRIKDSGFRQKHKVILYEGQVLDGWHRYQAALMADVEPVFEEFHGSPDEARKLAGDENLFRRHISPGQRAGIILKLTQWQPVGKNHCKVAVTSDIKAMADAVKVSERTMWDAKAADKNGLLDKVANGEMSPRKAAQAKKRNGKPAPKRKSEPQPESPSLTALQERIEELEEVLKDYEACNAELEQLRKIVEADQPLLEAHKEIKRLTELVRILEERQVGLMNAEASAIRSAKSWKRKYEQLEK